MRVLMFGWEFPPHNSGGLGVACLGLTNGLTSEDVDVIFVLPKRVDLSPKNLDIAFADIPEITSKVTFEIFDSPIHPYITPESYQKQINQSHTKDVVYGQDLFSEVLRYGASGGEVAKQHQFDVIHAHDWLSFGAGISAKKATGKPLIVHIHATEFDRSKNGVHPGIYELEKQGFEAADLIVAVSEYTRQSVICNYGIDPAKVQVVHNGIDSDSMEMADKIHPGIEQFKKDGFKVVLFLGRITSQKAPDAFVKAAKMVLDYDPKVRFIMVGSGDMEAEIKDMIFDLGMSDNFWFPGFVRGMEKAQIYKGADLYVMPSASEPFGIVGLEAMINGTPTIISKQSGLSEVVKHSLQVDFWDIEELANQMLAVIHHKPLNKKMSELGEAEAKEVTWNKAARKLKGIYSSFISNKK